MTDRPPPTNDADELMARTRSADWETQLAAVRGLRACVDREQVRARLVELLDDPQNVAVIEAAAAVLAFEGGRRGLTQIAAVFDALDEQAAAYAAVAVSDALGDVVFERLLEVITGTADSRVQDGARHLGSQIGMQTSPQWQHAFPG